MPVSQEALSPTIIKGWWQGQTPNAENSCHSITKSSPRKSSWENSIAGSVAPQGEV